MFNVEDYKKYKKVCRGLDNIPSLVLCVCVGGGWRGRPTNIDRRALPGENGVLKDMPFLASLRPGLLWLHKFVLHC